MAILESPYVSEAIPDTHLEWALKQFFNSRETQSESLVQQRKKRLSVSACGTFGFALNTYYLNNRGLPFPGSPDSLFPADYLSLHDAHHVLLGARTDEAGEVYVTAFECGLMSETEAKVLPVLAQIQVLLEHKGIALYDAAIASKAFSVGVKTSRALLDQFDPWEFLDTPIQQIREDMGIAPISCVWG